MTQQCQHSAEMATGCTRFRRQIECRTNVSGTQQYRSGVNGSTDVKCPTTLHSWISGGFHTVGCIPSEHLRSTYCILIGHRIPPTALDNRPTSIWKSFQVLWFLQVSSSFSNVPQLSANPSVCYLHSPSCNQPTKPECRNAKCHNGMSSLQQFSQACLYHTSFFNNVFPFLVLLAFLIGSHLQLVVGQLCQIGT